MYSCGIRERVGGGRDVGEGEEGRDVGEGGGGRDVGEGEGREEGEVWR